jgi:hypothetical protein
MALFTRNRSAQMAVSEEPATKAAIGYGSNAGASQIGNFYAYIDGNARQRAMGVPAISRSRDLIASIVATIGFKFYRKQWNGEEMERVYIAPRSWAERLDPTVTNNFIMAWTFDDLFHYGRAFWHVQSRTADGYPATFTRLPAAMVTSQDQAGPVWFGPSNQLLFSGLQLEANDVIQFLSPIQGLLYMAQGPINTAIRLEDAAWRNAASAIPAGVLKQKSGEPLTAQEMRDMAQAFNEARATNQTAFISQELDYEATTATPDKMLLVESREFQAKELSRYANVPAYLLGIDVGGYTYQNASQAKQDLYLFAAKNYLEVFNQTLSANNVLPNGTYVCLDVESYLEEMNTEGVYVEETVSPTETPNQPNPMNED